MMENEAHEDLTAEGQRGPSGRGGGAGGVGPGPCRVCVGGGRVGVGQGPVQSAGPGLS